MDDEQRKPLEYFASPRHRVQFLAFKNDHALFQLPSDVNAASSREVQGRKAANIHGLVVDSDGESVDGPSHIEFESKEHSIDITAICLSRSETFIGTRKVYTPRTKVNLFPNQ